MKVLIAPLNWGLGHATRCIPLIRKYLADGAEVVIAGDGESFALLKKQFPDLRALPFPELNLTYSKRNSQVWAIAKALPRLIIWGLKDHFALKNLLAWEQFDRVVSDNRFGFYISLIPETPGKPTNRTETIYITHQLVIKTPRWLRGLEPLLASIHRHIISKYTQCWIPDNAGADNLSGELSHKYQLPSNARFIGPLSRFPVTIKQTDDESTPKEHYDVVAVLSGLEPQRTKLEEEIIRRYQSTDKRVLIVRGKPEEAHTQIKHKNITLIPSMNDADLQERILETDHIIARSGYSTIMDLEALECLNKAELIPTPGQPEQKYLAEYLKIKKEKQKNEEPTQIK